MEIRKATIDDAAAIACNVMAAMDFDMFGGELAPELKTMLEGMTNICAREDTLYSWKNTFVACEDGVIAGSLTAYDGGGYLAMRELTFSLARENFGWTPPVMDDETSAGEWYLDSLAILPAFRKRGIAKALVGAMLEEATKAGFHKVSLIALASADRLIAHYESFGFHPERHLNCFGHDYLRMVAEI